MEYNYKGTIIKMVKVYAFKDLENKFFVYKFTKPHTKRVFYIPTNIEGKNLSRTLWVRKYDAITSGKKWLEYKKKFNF